MRILLYLTMFVDLSCCVAEAAPWGVDAGGCGSKAGFGSTEAQEKSVVVTQAGYA